MLVTAFLIAELLHERFVASAVNIEVNVGRIARVAGKGALVRILPEGPLLVVGEDGTGVKIPDPDGIVCVIIGNIGRVGFGRGINDGALAIVCLQAVQELCKLFADHFFIGGGIAVVAAVKFDIDDRRQRIFLQGNGFNVVRRLVSAAGLIAEKMVSADFQRGFAGHFPVVFEFFILKAAALGCFDKGKGQIVIRQDRPVNIALIGRDIDALYRIGSRVGMIELQDTPVIEQKG